MLLCNEFIYLLKPLKGLLYQQLKVLTIYYFKIGHSKSMSFTVIEEQKSQ